MITRYSMRIGQSRPRALATSLAGLLTLGSNAPPYVFPGLPSDICKGRSPITAAGAVEVFHPIPIFTPVKGDQ